MPRTRAKRIHGIIPTTIRARIIKQTNINAKTAYNGTAIINPNGIPIGAKIHQGEIGAPARQAIPSPNVNSANNPHIPIRGLRLYFFFAMFSPFPFII